MHEHPHTLSNQLSLQYRSPSALVNGLAIPAENNKYFLRASIYAFFGAILLTVLLRIADLDVHLWGDDDKASGDLSDFLLGVFIAIFYTFGRLGFKYVRQSLTNSEFVCQFLVRNVLTSFNATPILLAIEYLFRSVYSSDLNIPGPHQTVALKGSTLVATLIGVLATASIDKILDTCIPANRYSLTYWARQRNQLESQYTAETLPLPVTQTKNYN